MASNSTGLIWEITVIPLCLGYLLTGDGTNKSHVFSVGFRAVGSTKDSEAKCLDIFKLFDKAGGCSSDRPSGLSEKQGICVNNFRSTTSIFVIVALLQFLWKPEAQGFVRTFPGLKSDLGLRCSVNSKLRTRYCYIFNYFNVACLGCGSNAETLLDVLFKILNGFIPWKG